MSGRRIAAIVVLIAAIGAVVFYFRQSHSAPVAQPDMAIGSSPNATSAVQLELVKGNAKTQNVVANTGDFFTGPRTSPVAMKWTQLSVAAVGGLNPVVTNANGVALYRFDKDTANPPRSNCDGSCLNAWQPVLVRSGSKVFADGVDEAGIGSVTRSDGTNQVTLGGWPVYHYVPDTQPGDVKGQGVGNAWFAIAPDGSKAKQSTQGADNNTGLTYTNGTAQQNNAPANTGDFFKGPRNDPRAMKWVELSAGAAGGLSPIVHNGSGLTIYRFDKDTPRPPASHCNSGCTGTWSPILVQHGSRIFVNGVETAQVGIINRADGTRQVTLGGWPLYLYVGDTKAGDTAGEGVDSTWFAISPTGKKVQP
jgi:predicted lipoprotein with Yx(FWY)xxD motif